MLLSPGSGTFGATCASCSIHCCHFLYISSFFSASQFGQKAVNTCPEVRVKPPVNEGIVTTTTDPQPVKEEVNCRIVAFRFGLHVIAKQ